MDHQRTGEERLSAAKAWNIARLEGYDSPGLLADWLSESELHEYFAEFVYRLNSQSPYQSNGAWHMYTYYAQA